MILLGKNATTRSGEALEGASGVEVIVDDGGGLGCAA